MQDGGTARHRPILSIRARRRLPPARGRRRHGTTQFRHCIVRLRRTNSLCKLDAFWWCALSNARGTCRGPWICGWIELIFNVWATSIGNRPFPSFHALTVSLLEALRRDCIEEGEEARGLHHDSPAASGRARRSRTRSSRSRQPRNKDMIPGVVLILGNFA